MTKGIGFYTLAKQLDSNEPRLRNMVEAGLLPPPDKANGTYSQALANQLGNRFSKLDLHKASDVARMAGISPTKFFTYTKAGKVKAPDVKVGRICYYTGDDARAVAKEVEALEQEVAGYTNANTLRHEKRRQAGYLSITDVCPLLGCTRIVVEYALQHGWLPYPSHQLTGFVGWFYHESQLGELEHALALSKDEKTRRHYDKPEGYEMSQCYLNRLAH